MKLAYVADLINDDFKPEYSELYKDYWAYEYIEYNYSHSYCIYDYRDITVRGIDNILKSWVNKLIQKLGNFNLIDVCNEILTTSKLKARQIDNDIWVLKQRNTNDYCIVISKIGSIQTLEDFRNSYNIIETFKIGNFDFAKSIEYVNL